MTSLLHGFHGQIFSQVSSDRLRDATYTTAPQNKWMTVTPSIARTWLEKNANNRKIKLPSLNQYVRDMKEGRWNQKNPEPIILGPGEVLIDGQHRLMALINANVSLSFNVYFNVSLDVMGCINIGNKRTPADSIRLGFGKKITNRHIAALTRFLSPLTTMKLSPVELNQLEDKYAEPIAFAMSNPGSHVHKVTDANYRAVIARAWYHPDRERLIEFGRCMTTGTFPNGLQDNGAALFFRLCKDRKAFLGTNNNSECWGKTERAVLAFLNREPITKLYSADEELFPIPSESN